MIMGTAVISTEEYKELLEAQKDMEIYKECYRRAEQELKIRNAELNELLLLLTKGQKKSEWSNGLFNNFDLADGNIIAEYINEKYLENGMLKLKEND